jgi:hypothetical protein
MNRLGSDPGTICPWAATTLTDGEALSRAEFWRGSGRQRYRPLAGDSNGTSLMRPEDSA